MASLRKLALAFLTGAALDAAVTLPAAAQAQPIFSADDFFVGVQASPGVDLSAAEVARFFNLASYQCAHPVYLFIALQPSGKAKRDAALASTGNAGSIQVWLGGDCTTLTNQGNPALCREMGAQPLSTFLTQGSWTVMTSGLTLGSLGGSTAATDAGAPYSAEGTTFVQPMTVVVDSNGDGTADLAVKSSVFIDLEPPPAPAGATVAAGNQAIELQWSQVDSTVTTDLAGYQVLCSRADQYQVFKETATEGGGATGQFSAGFETCLNVQTAGGGVEALDPTFVCSPLLSPTTTSYRIEVLQNGITYAAAVVAVDKSGNPSANPQILFGTPVTPATFDPGVKTGFCSVSPTPATWGSTGAALTALGALLVALRLRRRRSR